MTRRIGGEEVTRSFVVGRLWVSWFKTPIWPPALHRYERWVLDIGRLTVSWR